MKALKDDRAQVGKLRTQLEHASMRMEQEKAAWKRQQVCLCLLAVPRSVASVAVHTNQAPWSCHINICTTAGARCKLPMSSFACSSQCCWVDGFSSAVMQRRSSSGFIEQLN